MRPNDLLAATSDKNKGVVEVAGCIDNMLVVLAATVPVSVKKRELTNSFTVAPDKKKNGIIFVQVYTKTYNHRSNSKCCPFLISTYWKGDEPIVYLQERWISPADKLVQVGDHDLTVQTGGQIYTTDLSRKNEPNCKIVDNKDLLCQYLMGLVKKSEVDKSAKEYENEKTAVEKLAEIQKQAEIANKNFQEKEKETSQLIEIAAHWSETIRGLSEKVNKSKWGLGMWIKKYLLSRALKD